MDAMTLVAEVFLTSAVAVTDYDMSTVLRNSRESG